MNFKIKRKKILITNKLGLHARAAAKFVKVASNLKSKILVRKENNTVNGSSILGLMTLAAAKGSKITIICSGKNAENDLNCLVNLVISNFGEEPLEKRINLREKVYNGIGVSPGITIGTCFYQKKIGLEFSRYKILYGDVEAEIKRLEKAVNESITQLKDLIKKTKKEEYRGHNEMNFILEAHISMLNSSSLVKNAKRIIKKNLINSESAIGEELLRYEITFKNIKNQYFKERFDDVRDVCKRLISNLKKDKRKAKNIYNLEGKIIVSDEFSAADLLILQKRKIAGLVSTFGGPEGHFAIVARSFSIPTIVGIKTPLKNFESGDKLIIDGNKGIIIQNPNNATLRKYENLIDEQMNENVYLDNFRKIKPITIDKKRIFIEANVDNLSEVQDSVSKGVDGIGLFRSEYLYMNRKNFPSEKEQFEMIRKSIESLQGKILTIRTLDVGNDKQIQSFEKLISPSPNPALGLRAIRLTLAFPKIFEKQISAILRASYYGPIRIMLPMVSNVFELRESVKIIKKVRKKLIRDGIKLPKKIPPIGVLIETPAAALISESLSDWCDFLAIGTNDLTMYTLAIDRGDESVAKIYDPGHLSVLKLIKLTQESGRNRDIPVSVCGEMAGDIYFTALLIGIGINTLSMSTSRILKIKQFINNISLKDCKKLAKSVLKEKNNEKIKILLENFLNNTYKHTN